MMRNLVLAFVCLGALAAFLRYGCTVDRIMPKGGGMGSVVTRERDALVAETSEVGPQLIVPPPLQAGRRNGSREHTPVSVTVAGLPPGSSIQTGELKGNVMAWMGIRAAIAEGDENYAESELFRARYRLLATEPARSYEARWVDGSLEFDDVEDGIYTIDVDSPFWYLRPGHVSVDGKGVAVEADFQVGGALTCRLVDGDGKPVQGVLISTWVAFGTDEELEAPGNIRWSVSSIEGYAVLRGLEPRVEVRLFLHSGEDGTPVRLDVDNMVIAPSRTLDIGDVNISAIDGDFTRAAAVRDT